MIGLTTHLILSVVIVISIIGLLLIRRQSPVEVVRVRVERRER